MELRTETELTQEIERLRAELACREREAADNERQLERYATDLRETFKEERERTQQLTRSYMATVRALSNAVEAPDACTGKVAMPDAILFKPGALTAEERALMARHPVVGAEIVDGVEFLSEAAKVVRSHHERWDGTGYPDGLRAEEIPLAARVFAVADVLDALTTDRPYRPRMPLADARAMIVEAAGTQFDPMVVNAFERIDDATIERIGQDV